MDIRAAIESTRGKIRTYGELPGYAGFYFRPSPYVLNRKYYDLEEVALLQKAFPRFYHILSELWIQLEREMDWKREKLMYGLGLRSDLKLKDSAYLLRMAICGQSIAPDLFAAMEILGKARCLYSITFFMDEFNGNEISQEEIEWSNKEHWGAQLRIKKEEEKSKKELAKKNKMIVDKPKKIS